MTTTDEGYVVKWRRVENPVGPWTVVGRVGTFDVARDEVDRMVKHLVDGHVKYFEIVVMDPDGNVLDRFRRLPRTVRRPAPVAA